MQEATGRLACIGVVMLLFASFPAMMATEKEKTLFCVYESIFSFGRTENRVLKVDPNGRVSLTVKYGNIFSLGSEKKKSEAVLNAAELQALRDFIAGEAIQGLQGPYVDNALTTDYAASMEIEIKALKKPKRIVLPHLGFSGEHNSKIYPAPVHDLVCKIYGLEERVGIPYIHAVSVDLAEGEYDDTWCNSASLQLIPTPTPADRPVARIPNRPKS